VVIMPSRTLRLGVEFMAAATLGGTNAVVAVCWTRVPRPPAESVVDQLWAFVAGAVGLSHL
jgi:hypothetical protein